MRPRRVCHAEAFSPFSLAARPSIDSLPAPPQWPPPPPAMDPRLRSIGPRRGVRHRGTRQGPTDCGGRRAPLLGRSVRHRPAPPCPRGSIVGVWTNRYHGQCTRHKIRSATRLVERKKQDDGMWWPCIRRHSWTMLEGDGVSDFSRSSPPHVVQAPFPTRFFTRAEAHPRPLRSPSAAHEQTGHDVALHRYGVQSPVLCNTKQTKAGG